MSSEFVAVVTAGASAAWVACWVVVWAATRPARVRPDPPTVQLGEEPPAVVHLLANRGRLSVAAEATLLDLAARRLLELRPAGPDPRDTFVRVGPQEPGELSGEPPGELLPYEELVLDRVRRLAAAAGEVPAGEVPVGALAFRDRDRTRRWQSQLRQMVVADARRRGLTRRRVGTTTVVGFSVAAMLAAVGPALPAYALAGVPLAAVAWIGVTVVLWILMAGLEGERHTPAGVAAAARWLGVRDWLATQDGVREAPPGAVATWGRYLAYGVALRAAPAAGAALDLGMGNRRWVWSSYGGRWRQVRIRYPLVRPHLGAADHVLVLLVQATLLPVGLAGCFVATGFQWLGWTAVGIGAAAAALPLGYGCYLAVRGLRDRRAERTVTGEVLWIRPWRYRRTTHPRFEPWLHSLAVDDGTGDRATAWGLPSERAEAEEVVAGDTVEVVVRPWTRRVTRLRTLARGARRDDPRGWSGSVDAVDAH